MAGDAHPQTNELLLHYQLQQAKKEHNQKAQCLALVQLALYYDRQQNYPLACPLFEELLPLARTLQDRDSEKFALFGLASTLTHMQSYHKSIPLWSELIQLAREVSDTEAELEGLSNLGFVYQQADLPEDALPFLWEAIERTRKMSDKRALPNMLNNLGVVHSKLGNHKEAIATYQHALLIAREWEDKENQAFQLGNIGHEYADHLHQPDQAVIYFTQALSLFRELRDSHYEAQTLYNIGRAYWLAGDGLQAQRHLLQARDQAQQLRDETLLMRTLTTLSEISAKQGQLDAALRYYHQGHSVEGPSIALRRHQEERQHARECGDTRAEAYHLGEVAAAFGRLQRQAEALSANLETISLYRRLNDRHGEAICLINIGTLCYFVDQQALCLACWQRGRDLLAGERSPEEEMIYRKLAQLEHLWGKATFQQAQKESLRLFGYLRGSTEHLHKVFAPLFALFPKEDTLRAFLEECAEPVEHTAVQNHDILSQESEQVYQFLVGLSSMSRPPEEKDISMETLLESLLEQEQADLEEIKRLIQQGRLFLRKKRYDDALEVLSDAIDYDVDNNTSARFWYAFTCLWAGDLEEAASLFEDIANEEDGNGEGGLALILTEWCQMCLCSSRQAYWDRLKELYDCGDEKEFQDMLEPFVPDLERGESEKELRAGLQYMAQGNSEACLHVLDHVNIAGSPFLPWMRTFWQAMAYATQGDEDEATDLLRATLKLGTPPVLLGPLRWLKFGNLKQRRWYEYIVRPLFVTQDFLYDERPHLPSPNGLSTLPSQAGKLAQIRPALLMMRAAAEEVEPTQKLQLMLSGARGYEDLASLIFIEFDSVELDKQQRIWPTTFAVRFSGVPASIGSCVQRYQINYTPGVPWVTLVDCGFQALTDTIWISGRDYRPAGDAYLGRGGIYWVTQEDDIPIRTSGTTTRLDHLPSETVPYLQTIINEALPFLEIYCKSCERKVSQVNGVWCEHIWQCAPCRHISSPIERSRKLMRVSSSYCSHRFPRGYDKHLGERACPM